jgi:hypothetical protein
MFDAVEKFLIGLLVLCSLAFIFILVALAVVAPWWVTPLILSSPALCFGIGHVVDRWWG